MNTTATGSGRQFDIIARIRADLSEFRNSMTQMVSGFRNTSNQIENTNNNTNNRMVDSFRNQIPSAIGKTHDALGSLENKLKALFTLYAGKKLFDYTAGQGMQFEDYTGGFEAIYKGNTKRAMSKMDELRIFAQKTPYQLPEVVEAGMTLEGVGMDTNKYLKPAGDLASFNKSKGATIGSTAQIFRNAWTGNYGMAIEDLRNMGIMQTDLARNGVKFAGNGSPVGSQKVFMEAMVKSIQQSGANNYMDVLSSKTSGMISNIKDSLSNFGRLMSESFFGKFHKGIKNVMDSLAKLEVNGSLKAFAQMMARSLDPLFAMFQNLSVAFVKGIESGRIAEVMSKIGTAFTAVGQIILMIINIISTLAGWLFNLSGKGNTLSGVLWSLIAGFLAFRVILTVIKWIMALREALIAMQAIGIAMNITNPLGWVSLAVTGIVLLISQVQALKDLLASFLRWAGLGSIGDFISPSTATTKSPSATDKSNPKNPDDNLTFEQLRKKAEAEAKASQKIADDNAKKDNSDSSKVRNTGLDLESQMKGLNDIRDATIKIQELRNSTSLQTLEKKGDTKADSKYLETQRVGSLAMLYQYQQGMKEQRSIIAMAGNNVADIGTKREATQKLLEYQQKSNDILLEIANNTKDIQNITAVTNADAKLGELKKDVGLQGLELSGMRPETASYWYKTRDYLQGLQKTYQAGADKLKALIPGTSGDRRIEAETQYYTLQKQANDLLLQIKKNTDPRNGTFNLPSGIKGYSLLESKQTKGSKSGMTVSGNSFVFQVKEMMNKENIMNVMNQLEDKLLEQFNSDVRR